MRLFSVAIVEQFSTCINLERQGRLRGGARDLLVVSSSAISSPAATVSLAAELIGNRYQAANSFQVVTSCVLKRLNVPPRRWRLQLVSDTQPLQKPFRFRIIVTGVK